MDDGEDIRGQRPALVTSDASQQSPGNTFIFFSHFDVWKQHFLFTESKNALQSYYSLTVQKHVCILFTVVKCHIASSLKQTNGIIKRVFPVVWQLCREAYVCSENTTTTPFKAPASPSGFISHTFELRGDTFLKIPTFLRGFCVERREVRLSSSPLLSRRGKQHNMNLEDIQQKTRR